MSYYRKKIQAEVGGKVKDILFWIRPPSLNFYICHFTLTNFRKNKFSPWKFCKDLWHPIEFRMSKSKAHGNSTLIPQEFWNDFPSIPHPGSFKSSTPTPTVFFFWNSPIQFNSSWVFYTSFSSYLSRFQKCLKKGTMLVGKIIFDIFLLFCIYV